MSRVGCGRCAAGRLAVCFGWGDIWFQLHSWSLRVCARHPESRPQISHIVVGRLVLHMHDVLAAYATGVS